MSNMRSKSKVSLCSGDKLYPFGDSCHSILIHVSNTKHGQHQHIFEWSFVRKLPLGRLELKIYHKVYYLSCVKFTQGYRFTSLQQRSVRGGCVCVSWRDTGSAIWYIFTSMPFFWSWTNLLETVLLFMSRSWAMSVSLDHLFYIVLLVVPNEKKNHYAENSFDIPLWKANFDKKWGQGQT